jgi:hypothetical protein
MLHDYHVIHSVRYYPWFHLTVYTGALLYWKKVSQCYLIHHRSPMDWCRIEPVALPSQVIIIAPVPLALTSNVI